MLHDMDELREKLKQECYSAYFAGGYGGALMESFEIDSASPEELIQIAKNQGMRVDGYEAGFFEVNHNEEDRNRI